MRAIIPWIPIIGLGYSLDRMLLRKRMPEGFELGLPIVILNGIWQGFCFWIAGFVPGQLLSL